MITIEDVIGMTDLTEEEISAIATHEHIPEIAAAALADYLLHRPKGPAAIKQMILDDISKAAATGDLAEARKLVMALAHFVSQHPEAV